MADKMDIFSRRMVNINGDLRERVIYQRHMAEDIFAFASGVIDEELAIVASGILAEDYVLAGAAKNIPNPHFIYALDTNVLPDASGTRSVGSAATPWGAGAFDELYVPSIINDVDVYGNVNVHGSVRQINYDEYDVIELNVSGDTKLGDGTDDVIDLVGTIVSSSGNILINDTLTPTASGVNDLGSVTYPFNKVYTDDGIVCQETSSTYVVSVLGKDDTGLWTRRKTSPPAMDQMALYMDGAPIISINNPATIDPYIQLRGMTTVYDDLRVSASGTYDFGIVNNAWKDGYIDKVYLENAVPTYPLQATTKQYVDANPIAMEEPTGFIDRVAAMSFVNATRVFTITGDHDILISGARTTKTTDSITLGNSTGTHWIYYDAAGTLSEATALPGFDIPLIATVYYNTTVGFDKGLLGEERHGIKMDGDTHSWMHYTVGTRYESGLTSSFSNTTFFITPGIIIDEDIAHSIGTESTCDIVYKDGAADFVWLENQTQYYYNAPSDLYYNNGNVLTSVGANQYVAYWIFATNSTTRPIVSLMGQRVDGNIANARENNKYESLTLGQLPFEEMKLLYRVILRNDATPYVETQDLRAVSNLPAGTYVATQHNALTGLNWAQAGHTIDADIVPTASGTLDLGSISYAFNDAYIDIVNLEKDPTLPLQAATKQYVDNNAGGGAHSDLTNLDWDVAGHVINADITPSASGTIDLGSVAFAFDDAYIDKVNLEGDPTTPLQAATKQYVDNQIGGSGTGITGEIKIWSTDSAPAGYLLCDGDAISRGTYSSLFAVIGTTYGVVNGSTTFNVPDLRGRVPLGKDNMGGSSADRVTASEADNIGQGSGSETHTLTESEMPSHSHGVGVWVGGGSYEAYDVSQGTNSNATITSQTTGNDLAHNNTQPYQTISYIIKT